MAENAYRCSCGKVFKTAQGLAGHKRFCKKDVGQSKAEENVAGWEQRFSGLEQDCKELFKLYEELLDRLNQLEQNVNVLISYVCPGGKNIIGVNSSRTIELQAKLVALELEMNASQKKLEREIKGWVWNVIPERFRPKY